ncbi:MAG: hypothetical protein V1885_00155 [Candidatus Brennerbacteria bacterium]
MKRWFESMRNTFMLGLEAMISVIAAWGIVSSFTEKPGPRMLVSLFGWEPIEFHPMMDALLALLVPVVTMGITRISYWRAEIKLDSDSVDTDYAIFFGISACITLLALAGSFGAKLLGWLPYGNTVVLPISGILLLIIALLSGKDEWVISVPAAALGFAVTAVCANGIVHGWLFPWTILMWWVFENVVIPWDEERVRRKTVAPSST